MCMTLLRFHLHNWKTNFFSNNISLIIAAFVTGIVSGCCAWLLKHLIYWISQPITTAVKPDTPNYIFILLPLTGTILAVLYQKYIVGQDIYNGLQRLSNRQIFTRTHPRSYHYMLDHYRLGRISWIRRADRQFRSCYRK